MPIVSISQQPTSNSLTAAYRPVILKCTAQHTLPVSPTTFIPPVVYCDIYFNNVFYKTLTKTQTVNKPDFVAGINPLFEFDIQDAAQEYLRTELASNGGDQLYETTTEMVSVYCRFRSSGYNTNGFIVAEGTAPIQGTGSKLPVAGTGTQSNNFYVLNMSLQHEHNQDLATHLQYVKANTNGAWSMTDAYPASHRPKFYYVGLNDSDYYPFVYRGNTDIKCVKLYYKVKDKLTYQTERYCRCTGRIIGSYTLPDAIATKAYLYDITANIDAPFTLNIITKPAWMTITVSSTKISFSGTPIRADIATIPVTVSFTIVNCSGTNIIPFSSTILVVKPCEAIFVGSPGFMPYAYATKAYTYSFKVLIDIPYSVNIIVKPAWMTIQVTSTQVVFSGTPAITDISTMPAITKLEIINCGGANTLSFYDATLMVRGLPTLTLISDTRTGSIFFPRRRQVFRVGPYVYAGYVYVLKISAAPGTEAGVVAIGGDSPTSIAQKLADVVRRTSYPVTIYSIVNSGTDIIIELRYPYRFDPIVLTS